MPAPDLPTVKAYLGDSSRWSDAQINSAIAAESAAQSSACRLPSTESEWPADLTEALCRRVARNLAMRALPLAVQQSMTELGPSAIRLGGSDPEVRRLEAPYRRLVVG